MKAVGAATREGAAMAKGEAPFDAAKAQAGFKTYGDAAKKMPGLYPDSAKTGGETTAAPKIWEDQAGFKAAFAKFDADAAKGAAGTTHAERTSRLVEMLKASALAEGHEAVLMPGEIELTRAAEASKTGISLSENVAADLDEIARKVGASRLSALERADP